MDDGPWLYYKLTNEPKGSGELKMVDRRVDRRVDDGPWLYYKLTNEPKGSGELKRLNTSISSNSDSLQ